MNTFLYTRACCVIRPFIYLLLFQFIVLESLHAQEKTNPINSINYTLTFPQPEKHTYHVRLQLSNIDKKSITLKMPQWMPGYYQIMNYANAVQKFTVQTMDGNPVPFYRVKNYAWKIQKSASSLIINYDIVTKRQFVANSYVDASHAYIIPTNTFLYPENQLNIPVTVKIIPSKNWKNTVTGLERIVKNKEEFIAKNFDILYDSPFLIGNLKKLPSFQVKGITHRFVGYKMGNFDGTSFINNLKAVVTAATNIIGDIPYKKYTFIAIGPGRGGIEHLNNTTVSFNGNSLKTSTGMNTMMNFLAHEYFHHYNVKRIRPFELGPFDYDQGSKTNLLWVSEGLSVYYEYMVVQRAGLKPKGQLFRDFQSNINTFENNPGKNFQSLTEASFRTWKDGPFGASGNDKNKSISYYQKGPIVGLILDFAIRNATQNNKSLDDVMRYLYWQYYKKMQRGFTDAEFESACESIAGKNLSDVFSYVYSTKVLNYSRYLGYAGLKLTMKTTEKGRKKFTISTFKNPTKLQTAILQSWLGNN